MNKYSIKTSLNTDSIQNEIRLLLSVPNSKHSTVILFEGIEDIKLFIPLLDEKHVYLFKSYCGKPGVKEILNKFSFDFRVIGIVDKDYEKNSINKLFYCDYCNAEMMIISNDTSLEYSLFQVTSKNLDTLNLKNTIFKKLSYFSAIRKLNEELSWGIPFYKISLKNIITTNCNLDDTIKLINSKSPDNKITKDQKELIQKEYESLLNKNPLEYTNGHDFLIALLIELKEKESCKMIKSLSVDEFATIVRMGYHKDNFKESHLYKKLKDYQLEHNLCIV